MVEWNDVQLFLEAARAGGFGAAARAVGTMQSTVSRRIAALERGLGVKLFDRTPTGLELTAAGRRVLAQAAPAEASLASLGDVAALTSNTVTGLVRIAVSETMASHLLIPEVLPGLLEKHPELRIDLVVSDEATDLSRREADLAVRFFLPQRGDFVTKRVTRFQTAPLVSPKLHRRLSRLPPQAWPWVSVGREVPEEQWLAQLGVKPRISTSSFHTQLEAVRQGLGVAVLPTILGLLPPRLKVLEVEGPELPSLDVFLVTPRGLRRAPRVAAVFDAITEAFERISTMQ